MSRNHLVAQRFKLVPKSKTSVASFSTCGLLQTGIALVEKQEGNLTVLVLCTISTTAANDEGLTLETSVFESFTVANLPYRPCG